MIPLYIITEWRKRHSWPLQNQVDQDLLISRVLVELYSDAKIASSLAFRGGTALYKLFFTPSPRYSEDIDLVQVNAEPIGGILDRIRNILDPLFGTPQRKLDKALATITYRFLSEEVPHLNLRLKIEINTREHFAVMGFAKKDFSVSTSWFSGQAEILTYHLEELMATKLRALYQRNKGRDLFDFWFVLNNSQLDVQNTIQIFSRYMEQQGLSISRAQFEQNLYEKEASKTFLEDVPPLLSAEMVAKWQSHKVLSLIQNKVISRLPGDPWKG